MVATELQSVAWKAGSRNVPAVNNCAACKCQAPRLPENADDLYLASKRRYTCEVFQFLLVCHEVAICFFELRPYYYIARQLTEKTKENAHEPDKKKKRTTTAQEVR